METKKKVIQTLKLFGKGAEVGHYFILLFNTHLFPTRVGFLEFPHSESYKFFFLNGLKLLHDGVRCESIPFWNEG